MKKLISKIVSHKISLFGNLFILGFNYNPNVGKKYADKVYKMEYICISLGILSIIFNFSDNGIHAICLTTTLSSNYRGDLIKIQFPLYPNEKTVIQHEWYVKENGNKTWKYKILA